MTFLRQLWNRILGCDHKGQIEIQGERGGCDICRCKRCGITYDYPQG